MQKKNQSDGGERWGKELLKKFLPPDPLAQNFRGSVHAGVRIEKANSSGAQTLKDLLFLAVDLHPT